MVERVKGQSLLDFLWENYGGRLVDNLKDPDSIPSFALIQTLLSDISSDSVGSITVEDGYLVIKSIDGKEIDRINIGESLKIGAIKDFGRRIITKDDIAAGSPYLLYQPIYYIKLDNGVEYTAPIDIIVGGESKTIRNTVLDNTVYSDLRFSDKIKGVVFSQEEDGIAGRVQLENSNRGIRFSIMSKDEYKNSIHDLTTLYFIKGEPYMYFGDKLLSNNAIEDFEEVYRRLDDIEYSINWEENE